MHAMYIYIYIYIYAYIYTCMHVYIYACLYIYIYTYIHTYIHTCCVDCFPVIGELSTEDPHVVGYVSDTITLPCEHTVPMSHLEAVVWRKDTVTIVAEYDTDDDPPVSFYGCVAGRASAKVFPPTLKFSNGSLQDAGVYQCEIFPATGDPIVHRYTVTVNGRERLYLETRHIGRCTFVHGRISACGVIFCLQGTFLTDKI